MGVGDELGPLVLSLVRLQEDVQHAHCHPGERDEVGEGLPHASCGGVRRLRPGGGPPGSHPPPAKPQAKVTVQRRLSGVGLRPAAPRPQPQYLSPPRRGRHST